MTSVFERDRILGADAIIADIKQFKRLEPIGLSDSEIAHRMATDALDVAKIRNLIGQGRVRLSSLRIAYHARILLARSSILTVGTLLSKPDKDLLAIRGVGPKTLMKIKEAVCIFMEESYNG